MFSKPPEYSIITVTTRHRDIYIHATSPYKLTKYENVRVLNYDDNRLGPNDIKIEAPNKDGFTFINLNNVVELIVGGQKAEQTEPKSSHRSIIVEGSNGKFYTLLLKDEQPISCTCPQFTFRKQTCKHMLNITQQLVARRPKIM